MNKLTFSAVALLVVFCFGCKQKNDKQDFLVVNIDSTVQPGTDFFEYANGGWIKKNPDSLR